MIVELTTSDIMVTKTSVLTKFFNERKEEKGSYNFLVGHYFAKAVKGLKFSLLMGRLNQRELCSRKY